MELCTSTTVIFPSWVWGRETTPSSAGPAGMSAVEPCQTDLVTSTIPMELKSLMKGQAMGFIATEVKRSYI